MENIKVKNIIIAYQNEKNENFMKLIEIVNRREQNVIFVNIGDIIEIEENVYLYILWPNKENFIQENSMNNNSIVCKLKYNNISILFTGDIERIAEERILQEYNNKNILKSTILKVAHHGSKSSSTKDFIEMVNPKISLIGVGKDNLFGHPNGKVINNLENIRIKSA